MMLAVAAINRARSAAQTFTRMTLFDHYCAKLHVGLALDGVTALALREAIDRTLENTPGALAFHPFRRAAAGAFRAAMRAPLALADRASGGRGRKLLAKRSEGVTEAEVVEELDQVIENALANKTGFLSRS